MSFVSYLLRKIVSTKHGFVAAKQPFNRANAHQIVFNEAFLYRFDGSCHRASSALASFVGMEYETVAETAYGTTYRVYATFDNPNDELVAVYALETAPMTVGVSTSFYQDAVGAVLAQTINPLFFTTFPSLEYDNVGSPSDPRIRMEPATCNKWAWIHISRRLKMEVGSPSTPSLEGRGLSCQIKAPMRKRELMVAFWLGNSPLMAWSI